MIRNKNRSNFIINLYNLICRDIKNSELSVMWYNKCNKYGFYVLNIRLFHERCILNFITKSYNHKYLFRQFNNYGFKCEGNFWYHSEENFYKDFKSFDNIKFKKKSYKIKKKISKKGNNIINPIYKEKLIENLTNEFLKNELEKIKFKNKKRKFDDLKNFHTFENFLSNDDLLILNDLDLF